MEPIITSILTTDLYKLTMGQAVAKEFARAPVSYSFINRGKTVFPKGFADELRNQIELMSQLRLTKDELSFLTAKCGRFLDPVYLNMILSGYQFDPREVKISQNDGDLSVEINGEWARTIYWEVPLMALIVELYYLLEKHPLMIRSRVATLSEVYDEAYKKGVRLAEAKCKLSEFGTRRRHSGKIQQTVLKALKESMGEYLIGTSNVQLAMEMGITPQGTQAHEWISGIAAIEGLEKANLKSMQRWSKVYNGDLGIALTDTFGTDSFFRDFNLYYAKLFDGVRHDSGDPISFGERVIEHYDKLRIDPKSKIIFFSDGLDVDSAIMIKHHFKDRVKISFGIGTSLTNDIGYKPLNIVIKLINVCGTPAVKLSDNQGKEIGDSDYIRIAKKLHGCRDFMAAP